MVKRLEKAKKIRNSSNTFICPACDAVDGATRAAMVVNGGVNINSRAYSNVRGSSFSSSGAYSPLGRRVPVSVRSGNRAVNIGQIHGSLGQNGGLGDGSSGLDIGAIRRRVTGIGGGEGSATGSNLGEGGNGSDESLGFSGNSGIDGSMRFGSGSRGAGMGSLRNRNLSGFGTFGDGNGDTNVKTDLSAFRGNGNASAHGQLANDRICASGFTSNGTGNVSGRGRTANGRMGISGIGGNGNGNLSVHVQLANHRMDVSGIGGNGNGNVSGHGLVANHRMSGSRIGGVGNASGHVPLSNHRMNISGIGGNGREKSISRGGGL